MNSIEILPRGQDPTASAPHPDVRGAEIAELRARLAALDTLVSEGRDVVLRAEAAVDLAVGERNRALFELEQLADLNPDTDPR